MGSPEYVRMNLRVTPEARAAWEQFAVEQGVTSSALAEAIGRLMFDEGKPLSAAVAEARKISRDRLRRKG